MEICFTVADCSDVVSNGIITEKRCINDKPIGLKITNRRIRTKSTKMRTKRKSNNQAEPDSIDLKFVELGTVSMPY